MVDVPIVGNDFEEIPLDIKLLSDIKREIGLAGELARASGAASVTLVKALAEATNLGNAVFEKEQQVNDLLKNAAAVSGVSAEDFRGFDLERGTVRVKRSE